MIIHAVCIGQPAPTLDFGNIKLGNDSVAKAIVPNVPLSPSFQIKNASATFLNFSSSTPGPFQFVSDTNIIDITSGPDSFLIRFVPEDTGRITAQMMIAREVNYTYQGVPGIFQDTISILLSGRGLPVSVPPQQFIAPPSTFILFPVNYAANTDSIDFAFETEFGPYSETEWRLFSYLPNLARYVEYSGPAGNKRNPSTFFTSFQRANSYFLISRIGRSFLLPGTTLTSIHDGYLTLQRGWNLVSSPYPFDVDWDYTIVQQQLVNLFSRARAFINNTLEVSGSTGILKKNEGYFIFAQDSLNQISVRPQLFTSFKKTGAQKENGWSITIETHAGNQHFINSIGQRTDALKGFDRYDFPMPPLPMPIAHLTIHEPNDPLNPEYIDDFRNLNSEGEEWIMDIFRNSPQEKCTVCFRTSEYFPDQFSVYLLDNAAKKLIDITRTKRYDFDFSPSSQKREMHLLTGTKEFIQRHTGGYSMTVSDYALYPSYPNPIILSENTLPVIRFAIPRDDVITLSLSDVFGRMRETMYSGEIIAGEHFFSPALDGLPAGIYFYTLRAQSGWSDSKKMLIVR